MLDIYLIWASFMLLIVVVFFQPPLWAKILFLVFGVFALIVTWKRMDDPDDEELM